MTALKFLSATIKVEYGWNRGANFIASSCAKAWDGAFSFCFAKKFGIRNVEFGIASERAIKIKLYPHSWSDEEVAM